MRTCLFGLMVAGLFLQATATIATAADAKDEAIKKDRKHMTRDQVAAKWKCSAGTIDKYTR